MAGAEAAPSSPVSCPDTPRYLDLLDFILDSFDRIPIYIIPRIHLFCRDSLCSDHCNGEVSRSAGVAGDQRRHQHHAVLPRWHGPARPPPSHRGSHPCTDLPPVLPAALPADAQLPAGLAVTRCPQRDGALAHTGRRRVVGDKETPGSPGPTAASHARLVALGHHWLCLCTAPAGFVGTGWPCPGSCLSPRWHRDS